jgi:phage baseplate assembly protein W|tara:strand:+ start:3787 stop:4251 length:465 start_codon:yes stop_codon:yes gene_type:complete
MATVEKTSSFKDLDALVDSESTNDSLFFVQKYRDLDLFFTKRSRDKDINILTNVTAVKRSVRNLVLTNFYEKPFHPEIGCGIRGLLFENASPLTSIAMSQACKDVIISYEPRVNNVSVEVRPDLDRNAYDMTIRFTISDAPTELVELNVLLEVL